MQNIFETFSHEKIISVKFMDYTNILKQLREEKNLSQKDIAYILGISRGLYSQYEIADAHHRIYFL